MKYLIKKRLFFIFVKIIKGEGLKNEELIEYIGESKVLSK